MRYPISVKVKALALRAQGFTQVDAARRVDVHPRTLRRWEREWRGLATTPPPLAEISDDLWEAYHEERRASLRASLLLGALRASIADAERVSRRYAP